MDAPVRFPEQVRIGVVLSAGGLRGAGHLGVLRQLLAHRIPICVLAGVSAGAIVTAYYAAVGMSIDEMIEEARTFRGRHVLAHGMGLRAPRCLRPLVRPFSGVIPRRIKQLEHASFESLHHGVAGIGIVCHDLIANRARYFSSRKRQNITLAEAVKASASLPGLIPAQIVQRNGESFKLTDGGISDSLPVNFARESLGATHLIISDCRRETDFSSHEGAAVYVRPELEHVGVLRSPHDTLLRVVEQGERAITAAVLETIQGWAKQ